MNILFVSDSNLASSVVFDIHVLAESLSLAGHRVFVVCSQRDDRTITFTSKKSSLHRVFPNAKASLIQFGGIKIPCLRFFWGILSAHHTLKKLLQTESIDVIVAYSVLMTGWPVRRLSKQFQLPLLFRNIDMLHRLQPNAFRRAIVKHCEKKMYRHADCLLALSVNYADYLFELGADRQKVSILNFPIDLNIFHPKPCSSTLSKHWGIQGGDKLIVYMGHLYSFSELLTFVEKMPQLISIEPKLKLLIIGTGPLYEKIDTLRYRLGIDKNIILTGLQPFDLMPLYINLADVCLNAYSLDGDKNDLFCAKILQYMACGKPTVSSALPGIVKSLPSTETAIFYVDSVEAMARQIILLLQTPELCQQAGMQGVQFVRKKHDVRKITAQFDQCLQNLITWYDHSTKASSA